MIFLPDSLLEALFDIDSPVSLAPIAYLTGVGDGPDEEQADLEDETDHEDEIEPGDLGSSD